MSYLNLPPPDWDALLGGSEQEAKWLADRDRKYGLISDMAETFLPLSAELHDRGVLYRADPEILQEQPDAADWYISLASFAKNTLQYIRDAPENFGLSVRALTVRRNLVEGRSVSRDQRQAFCNWINAELDLLHPPEHRSLPRARAVAFALLGARAVGQGQNIGGEDGVLLLIRQVVQAFVDRGRTVQVDRGNGWEGHDPDKKLFEVQRVQIDGRMTFDFGGGGNRPDIVIRDLGLVVAKGEVKARKDVSNIWESWMPQIVDHIRTWTQESMDAARLFFGTLVTEEMIEGTSHSGVSRSGFKNLHSNGLLTNAYNISKVAAGDREAIRTFLSLIDALEERLPDL